MLDPANRPRHRDRHLGRGGPDRKFERIFAEQMQDIGDEQFLMLLLVMAAERHELACVLAQGRQRIEYRCVDRSAIAANLVQRRSCDHAAAVARVALALRLVIAVEQEREALVVPLVCSRRNRAVRTSRRTKWYARDAIWRGSHRASTGRSHRHPTAVRSAPAKARGRAANRSASAEREEGAGFSIVVLAWSSAGSVTGNRSYRVAVDQRFPLSAFRRAPTKRRPHRFCSHAARRRTDSRTAD